MKRALIVCLTFHLVAFSFLARGAEAPKKAEEAGSAREGNTKAAKVELIEPAVREKEVWIYSGGPEYEAKNLLGAGDDDAMRGSFDDFVFEYRLPPGRRALVLHNRGISSSVILIYEIGASEPGAVVNTKAGTLEAWLVRHVPVAEPFAVRTDAEWAAYLGGLKKEIQEFLALSTSERSRRPRTFGLIGEASIRLGGEPLAKEVNIRLKSMASLPRFDEWIDAEAKREEKWESLLKTAGGSERGKQSSLQSVHDRQEELRRFRASRAPLPASIDHLYILGWWYPKKPPLKFTWP